MEELGVGLEVEYDGDAWPVQLRLQEGQGAVERHLDVNTGTPRGGYGFQGMRFKRAALPTSLLDDPALHRHRTRHRHRPLGSPRSSWARSAQEDACVP